MLASPASDASGLNVAESEAMLVLLAPPPGVLPEAAEVAEEDDVLVGDRSCFRALRLDPGMVVG